LDNSVNTLSMIAAQNPEIRQFIYSAPQFTLSS
jgi:hypothetical protein